MDEGEGAAAEPGRVNRFLTASTAYVPTTHPPLPPNFVPAPPSLSWGRRWKALPDADVAH